MRSPWRTRRTRRLRPSRARAPRPEPQPLQHQHSPVGDARVRVPGARARGARQVSASLEVLTTDKRRAEARIAQLDADARREARTRRLAALPSVPY